MRGCCVLVPLAYPWTANAVCTFPAAVRDCTERGCALGHRPPARMSGRLTSTEVPDYDSFIDKQASFPADEEDLPQVAPLSPRGLLPTCCEQTLPWLLSNLIVSVPTPRCMATMAGPGCIPATYTAQTGRSVYSSAAAAAELQGMGVHQQQQQQQGGVQ